MTWVSEHLLQAIHKAAPEDCITEADLVELTGLNAKQVERAALILRRHGLVEKVGQGCHKLTDAGREAVAAGSRITSGPRGGQGFSRVWKNTLRGRAWRAIRIRRKFSVADLISLVAEGGERDIESNVGKYVRALARAGILVELPRREPGVALTSNGHKRYWLPDDRDPGPQAPVWSREKNRVYDPNGERYIDLGGQP